MPKLFDDLADNVKSDGMDRREFRAISLWICRLNKGHEDDQSEELWSTIVALLITAPLVVLLFGLASQDQNLTPASNTERSPLAPTIVLPLR